MTNGRLALFRASLILAVFLGVVTVRSLMSGDPFRQTGFVVSGDVVVRIWDETQTIELSGLDWGEFNNPNEMKTQFLWVETSEPYVRFNYYSNNPSWSIFELFYEGSPGRWSRWSNNTLYYLRNTWTHLMVRFTALAGAPDGFFNFTSYFSQV